MFYLKALKVTCTVQKLYKSQLNAERQVFFFLKCTKIAYITNLHFLFIIYLTPMIFYINMRLIVFVAIEILTCKSRNQHNRLPEQ